jgi:uroporphyrin-III C-methyltransferase/precorrin-2 dehydrogenase/sirohydrochlorin ferrochelatase/uroporphyrin-III C-methyltransferase
MNKLFIKGSIALIGAGPGDPELLTVKAMRLLQNADVILTDRLVSQEIIRRYACSTAEIIYVGKQCRKGESTPQATINELMVIFAKEGKQVVRLKGGDVSIFSNIVDELETLVQHNIPYEIVPGITAALGAAAYAGIPLTARNHATAVRLLTAYKSDVVPASYWKELAATDDTLVFYMSSETLDEVVGKLVANQISEDKLLAVIEQATTPFQKVYTSSLYEYEKILGNKKFLSPTLIIIGKVVMLHQQFNWFHAQKQHAEYFGSINEAAADTKNSFALTA